MSFVVMRTFVALALYGDAPTSMRIWEAPGGNGGGMTLEARVQLAQVSSASASSARVACL
jgi:hypothetical protein